MHQPPYSPAEFNALMDEAKVRAAQLRREAQRAWGARLWRWVSQLRPSAPAASAAASTPSTQTRKTPCPT